MSEIARLNAKLPRQPRGKRRVEILLDATADLIIRHGAEGLKMDMVAKQAATSPGSLYQFFPNRAALLTALMTRYGEELAILAAEIVQRQKAQRPASLAEAVRDFLAPFLEFYARNQAYVILAEASNRVFVDQKHVFFEDQAVEQALIQILSPFVSPSKLSRLAIISRMLIVTAHAALSETFAMSQDERKAWLTELDCWIQSYLATLTGA